MKSNPYQEIINTHEEQKEYGRLCRRKSKKYIVYTDWEAHIRECLLSFNNSKDLYNFKRYCINIDRSAQKAPEMYMSYILLLIPLYIDAFFKELPSFMINIVALGIMLYAIIQNKRIIRESCFFKDIIEIIEKIEKERVETN